MSRSLVLAVAAALLLPSLAQAQSRELAKDRFESRDDLRDKQVLESLIAAFDRARARNDHNGIRDVERRFRAAIVTEIEEGKDELDRDRRQVEQSRREVARDLSKGRPGEAHRDMRDLREDKRDAAKERRNIERHRAMLREIDSIYGRMDPMALSKMRGLMVEASHLATREMQENRQEMREDRRELREDRHDRPGPRR